MNRIIKSMQKSLKKKNIHACIFREDPRVQFAYDFFTFLIFKKLLVS